MSVGVMEEYIDRLDWEIWANRGVVLDLLREYCVRSSRVATLSLHGTYVE